MSLATLDHQRWAPVTVATATAPGILDAIFTLLTQANDYAGVAIASPLTAVTKRQNAGVTESIDFGFGAALSGVKGQICGVNAARTPLMSASTNGAHTWTANTIMAGLTRNAGAYQAWDHASAPWTSGNTVGLSKFFNVGTTTAARVHGIVTAESVNVYVESSTGTVLGCKLGALLDPESTEPLSTETDGRTYSVYVTGTAAMSTGMHTTASTGLTHNNTNDSTHFLQATPRTTGCKRVTRLHQGIASTTGTLTTPDAEPVALPMYFYDPVNDRFLGRMREVMFVRDAKLNQRQAPSADRWYYVSGSVSADADAFGYLT